MNRIDIGDFNIDLTLLGGQAFNWKKDGDFYLGSTSTTAFKVKYCDGQLYWQTYPNRDKFEHIQKYFDLDTNYSDVIKSLPKDSHLSESITKLGSLRILGQDFENALIGFISSSNKSIKGIRYSIDLLSRMYGKRVDVDGVDVYLLPTLEDLSKLSLDQLLETKLGFRAKYIQQVAQKYVSGSFNITQYMHNLEKYEKEVRGELLKLNGVGDKVADCVMVYGLGYKNIFPLDIWGKRVLFDLYHLDNKMKYDDMRDWCKNYFNGYACLAGQYLFENIRLTR